ncbi:MAG: hypothetical protein JST04_05875 [Bdellovibrionales bacterium]|nr:hypothetical protein [Bdellovibrionales bacterium]
MGFRLSVFIGVLVSFAIWGIARRTDELSPRFEAHEFAVLRSEYDTLRVQRPARRVDLFRELLDTAESTPMTHAMAEALAGFCKKVANSAEEAPAVQAEARLVLNTIEAKHLGRQPASEPAPAHEK